MHLGLSTEDRGFNLSLLICTRCDEFTVRFARMFAQPTRVRHRQAVRAAKVSGQPTTHGSPRQLLCPSHVRSPHTWIEFGLQRCIHFCYTDFTIVDWPVAVPGCGAEVAEYLHPNTTFSFVLFRFLRHHRCRLASSVEVDDDELRLPVLRGCLFAVWPFANGVEVHITNDGPLSWGIKHHLHYRLASISFAIAVYQNYHFFRQTSRCFARSPTLAIASTSRFTTTIAVPCPRQNKRHNRHKIHKIKVAFSILNHTSLFAL